MQCKIKRDGLPDQSKIAYKFKGIQETLMYITLLCDNGCTVTFKKRTVQVHKYGKIVLTGYKEAATKLWRFPQDETSPTDIP